MTGIDYRLPFPEYLAHPAISQSAIKTFMRSPAHYRHERDNPREDTDYFAAGRAVHALALEACTADMVARDNHINAMGYDMPAYAMAKAALVKAYGEEQ